MLSEGEVAFVQCFFVILLSELLSRASILAGLRYI